MQYSRNGTNFIAMGSQFNFNTPYDTGTAGALDGNASTNRVTGIGGVYTPTTAITNAEYFFCAGRTRTMRPTITALALMI